MSIIRDIKAVIKMTAKIIKQAIQLNFMFCLIVPEYKGIHFTWTKKGLFEWENSYPADCQFIRIYYKY